LKDLILLHTALPDKIDSNLVNFRKMAQLSNIFSHLMQVQNAVLPLEANIDLVNTIRVSGARRGRIGVRGTGGGGDRTPRPQANATFTSYSGVSRASRAGQVGARQ
jgi:hypothetical protein